MRQVLFSVGPIAQSLGIALDASNYYTPWVGTSGGSYTNAKFLNSPADTFRSLAVVWPSNSNNVSLYINGVLIGTDSISRDVLSGPAVLGALSDGSLISNPANGMVNCKIAHVLMFPGALTLAQIKALHNLLGYQYGLSIVT